MFVDKRFHHITFNVTQICADTCVSPTQRQEPPK